MEGLNLIDVAVFVAFVACVITVGMLKSRKEKTSEDYFLAGRGLIWPLIGFSLIAANISTEQFVGMSGNAASHLGLAIASYEWMAAITLVVVAFWFLPYFLRAGIFTMPEFLEYRYNPAARTIMALATILIYMLLLGAVTYSGALTIRTMAADMGYHVPLLYGSLAIGLIAMLYVTAGGLKACAWADLIQGSALIIGGAIIMIFAFLKLGSAKEVTSVIDVKTGAVATTIMDSSKGAISRFFELNRVRLNMFLPSTDKTLPWTALLVGLWIPNFYYWGLNQYITQRTLGSSSLSQGQRGIVFAAFMKLLVPFVIVIPGIIAFNLYAGDMQKAAASDNAAVFAKYVKANPDTQFFTVVQAPDDQAITTWQSDKSKYMIAVYPDDDSMKAIKVASPFVLPLTQADFDKAEVGEYSIFESEDEAWESVNPGLAVEVEAYNSKIKAAAQQAGAIPSPERPIAYKYDTALAQLLGKVLPQGVGVVGFVLAALLGAVVSSLAAMLNAASTIFSMDLYKKYISPNASQGTLVFLGRICVVVFTFVAIFLAPQLGNPKISNSIFTIIQESQGFLSPGILAVFVFGLLVHKAPPMAGVIGLITNFVAYGFLKYVSTIETLMSNHVMAFLFKNFLNRMAVCFFICLAVMLIITMVKPLAVPVEFKKNTALNLETSKLAKVVGVFIIIATLALYIIFSPLCVAK